MNVWDIKNYFEKNNSFPEMTESEQKLFLDFSKAEVDDMIEAYERYTYNHGGLRDEAKNMFKEIEQLEKMYKAIKKEVEN